MLSAPPSAFRCPYQVAKRFDLPDRGQLRQEEAAEFQRFGVPARPLVGAGQRFQPSERISLARAGASRNRSSAGLVQFSLADAHAGDAQADGGQVGLQGRRPLEELAGLARSPHLLHLGGQAGQQRLAVGILPQNQRAELFRLVVKMKRQQLAVKRQRGLRRRLVLVAGHRLRDAVALRLLECLVVGGPMPPAAGALVDDPLAAQRHQGHEEHHEPQAGVVGIEPRAGPASPAHAVAAAPVAPSVIMRSDAVDGSRHGVDPPGCKLPCYKPATA